MDASDRTRLSVLLIDVNPGCASEFDRLAGEFETLFAGKGYGRVEVVRDDGRVGRFYAVRRWASAEAAMRCHAAPDVQALTSRLYQLARVTHVVNGVRGAGPGRLLNADRRAGFDADRRSGFDRRLKNVGSPTGQERRSGRDRRLGPRRLRDRPGEIDLAAAARRAREHADAAFSHFRSAPPSRPRTARSSPAATSRTPPTA